MISSRQAQVFSCHTRSFVLGFPLISPRSVDLHVVSAEYTFVYRLQQLPVANYKISLARITLCKLGRRYFGMDACAFGPSMTFSVSVLRFSGSDLACGVEVADMVACVFTCFCSSSSLVRSLAGVWRSFSRCNLYVRFFKISFVTTSTPASHLQ